MRTASDHTVFVTGAGAGIGAATARRFANEGARVIAADYQADRLVATMAGFEDSMHGVSLDLRSSDAVFAAIESLPEDFQKVTVLVNNAGVGPGLEPAHEARLDDWEAIVDTNIKGVLYCSRALLPGMVERGKGHIVNISSTSATNNYKGGNVYGGSKAFVRQFSLNLRCDLLGTPIRVSSIEPGMTETRFTEVRYRDDASRTAAHYAGLKPLSGEDLADVIFYTTMLPAHVNINTLQVTPIGMAPAGYAIHRE